MALNFAPISLDQPTQYREGSPLLKAIAQGMGMGQSAQLFPQQLLKEKLANELSKITNQYEPRRLESNITGKELENQWLPRMNQSLISERAMSGRNIESMIGARNLENQLTQMKIKYPGLGEGGIVGELAFANMAADHPEIAKRLYGAQQQQQSQSQQSGVSPELASKMTLIPGLEQQIPQQQMPPTKATSPISDLLLKDIESQIEARKTRASSGLGGVGTKQETIYKQNVALDNKALNLNEDELREAAQVVANGGDTLSSGKKLNPPSDETLRALDRAVKSSSTAGLVTAQVRAGQAEAEIPVIDKYISEGRKPYGDTVLGQSMKLQQDSFNTNDDAAQTRLGKYYASDLLNFDKAALQTRIAGTESGVTIVNEIMEKARQSVNSNTLLKTDKARQVALETVSDALKEMMKARTKYGIGASAARRSGANKSEPEKSSEGGDKKSVWTPGAGLTRAE